MVRESAMAKSLLILVLPTACLGCTALAPAPAGAPAPAASPAAATASAPSHRYHCDHGIEFTVLFGEDSATVDAGPRGREALLRDAGGVTPLQSVYSNPRMRAEFGLGVSGREATLRDLLEPLVARCVRQ
jgi:hypothetical protein